MMTESADCLEVWTRSLFHTAGMVLLRARVSKPNRYWAVQKPVPR